MTWNDFISWYPHAIAIGSLVVGFLLLRLKGEFATRSEVTTLSANVAAVSQRVEIMDREMKHLPKREDIHELTVQLTRLQGNISEMRAEARGDREILGRVEGSLSRHEDIIAQASRAGVR